MGMYFSGKFYAKKINNLKIIKNAKTLSNFCFPCSEQKANFLTYECMLYSQSIDKGRITLVSKMLKKSQFKIWKLLLNNWPYFRNCFLKHSNTISIKKTLWKKSKPWKKTHINQNPAIFFLLVFFMVFLKLP